RFSHQPGLSIRTSTLDIFWTCRIFARSLIPTTVRGCLGFSLDTSPMHWLLRKSLICFFDSFFSIWARSLFTSLFEVSVRTILRLSSQQSFWVSTPTSCMPFTGIMAVVQRWRRYLCLLRAWRAQLARYGLRRSLSPAVLLLWLRSAFTFSSCCCCRAWDCGTH